MPVLSGRRASGSMVWMLRLSKFVAPLLLAPLAACATASTPDEAPPPWRIAGPLQAIITADGTTDPAIRGFWKSRGYGRLLRIDEAGVTQFETGAACYRPASSGEALSAMDSVSYRYFRALPEGRSAIFQLLRGDTNVVFDRLEALPEECTETPATTPRAVADAFLDAFDRHYAFFDRRPPNHSKRAERVNSAIRPDMSDAQLWDALAGYMDGLSDSHTKLIGEVGGERRRVQDGQGTTLPRMRAAEGGETAWLVGLSMPEESALICCDAMASR